MQGERGGIFDVKFIVVIIMATYYFAQIGDFLKEDDEAVLGKLVDKHQFALEELQRNAWKEEIKILKKELKRYINGYIAFEFSVPRMGKRIDVVIIIDGMVFIIEFKIGDKDYSSSSQLQVTDYALDLKDFHSGSHEALLIPIVVSSKAAYKEFKYQYLKSGISEVQKSNSDTLGKLIQLCLANFSYIKINPATWINSPYKPTPTIIEAAKHLFRTHTVTEIARNDADFYNLNKTTDAINKIIDEAKINNHKAICFITGVPGAGKTLAGLNIAVNRQNIAQEEHAVFLSGNGPLVNVLQEALARDQQGREPIPKNDAKRKTKEFIQLIHHFRDEALETKGAPFEKVVIFDEAQRAWSSEMLEKFMRQKKGKSEFHMSEPEFLIDTMDRHHDWTTIICLIGGGQEINTGEAGLQEWFQTIKNKFHNWHIYLSNKIIDSEYIGDNSLNQVLKGINYTLIPELHLETSLRSFRSHKVALFIKYLLDFNLSGAQTIYREIKNTYPILLTRDIATAKIWIKEQAKGTQRYGKIASSGAKRLREYGIWVQSKIEPIAWFLNNDKDVRSSYYLEDTATEFDIQGLELDWSIVCWDADLRIGENGFDYYSFKGSRWTKVNNERGRLYLKNSYRVLLTRSRQGFIIFIPEGNRKDDTRQPEYYDGIYNYLKKIGVNEI